ncbi:MAG: 1-deoxy-D-xylulose-5-phosphate reductoisomerase [Nitrospirota bacterium]
MKRIVILGSTGSIGTNTLDIVRRFPDQFQVVGLAANENRALFEKQIKEFRPTVAALFNKKSAHLLTDKKRYPRTEILSGPDGVMQVAACPNSDLVISAIVGAAGLLPTLSAIFAKKTVALANKETMVMAGSIVQREARLHQVQILPIDSEHSALFQLMLKGKQEEINRVILTASGGPLLRYTPAMMKQVTCKAALSHPTWKMGPKISIDSATLVNKGFEMIEARWLFDLPPEKIDVIIHPQSIVHSMVELNDLSVMAQMGLPDMRIPIAYALFYPNREPLPFQQLDLTKLSGLTFEMPNKKQFPLLATAIDTMTEGKTYPAVLNAANEEAVHAFLQEKIGFLDIYKLVRKVLDAHVPTSSDSIESVLMADRWARWEMTKLVQKGKK